MNDINLDRGLVRRHAEHLREAATEVYSAYTSASGITIGGDAFGAMCQFLPPIINAQNPHHLDVITSTASLLAVTADTLEAAADDVLETDAQVVAQVNKLESRLGSLG